MLNDSVGLLDLTHTTLGLFSLGVFLFTCFLVLFENKLSLPKSKPVLISTGIIWLTIAIHYKSKGYGGLVTDTLMYHLVEFSELMLFLLVVMVYVNALEERRFFYWIKDKLINFGFGFRSLFWLSGLLCFFLSSIVDNLTSGLLICSIIMAIGADNKKFVSLACTNVVVASNAGGVFSPFGDATTLLLWQRDIIDTFDFLNLFFPALVSFLLPSLFMSLAVPSEKPTEFLNGDLGHRASGNRVKTSLLKTQFE